MSKRSSLIVLSITAVIAVILSIVLLVYVFGGMKSSSVTIDVTEEISLPITIILECGQEKIVLYESDSIASTVTPFPSYNAEKEGAVWLVVGDEKYEILSYVDHVDSPIIEITGDATSLEVLAYTTLFQKNKEIFQSTKITIYE